MVEFQLPFKEKPDKTGYKFLSEAKEDDLQPQYASENIMMPVFMFGWIIWTGYMSYLQRYHPEMVWTFIGVSVVVFVGGIAGLREALIHHFNGPEVHYATVWRVDGTMTQGPLVVKKRIARSVRWLEQTILALEKELSPTGSTGPTGPDPGQGDVNVKGDQVG